MSESDLNALDRHRSWVEVWRDLSRIASSSYPLMTQESRDAYLAIPDVLNRCRESHLLVPERLRPVHFLCV